MDCSIILEGKMSRSRKKTDQMGFPKFEILLRNSYERAIEGKRSEPVTWSQNFRATALKLRGYNKSNKEGFYSNDPDRTKPGESTKHETPWGPVTASRGYDVKITTKKEDYEKNTVGDSYQDIIKTLAPPGSNRKDILTEFYKQANQLAHNEKSKPNFITTPKQRNAAAKLFGIINFAEELRTPSSGKEGMARIKKMIDHPNYDSFSDKKTAPFLAARSRGKKLQQGVRTMNKIGDCPTSLFPKEPSITNYLSTPSVRDANNHSDDEDSICKHNEYKISPKLFQKTANTTRTNSAAKTRSLQNHLDEADSDHQYSEDSSSSLKRTRLAHNAASSIEKSDLTSNGTSRSRNSATLGTSRSKKPTKISFNHSAKIFNK